MDNRTCHWCHAPLVKPRPDQRFCRNQGKCKNRYYNNLGRREHGIPGKVRYSRDLSLSKGGGKSVTIHFTPEQARRVQTNPGAIVRVVINGAGNEGESQ